MPAKHTSRAQRVQCGPPCTESMWAPQRPRPSDRRRRSKWPKRPGGGLGSLARPRDSFVNRTVRAQAEQKARWETPRPLGLARRHGEARRPLEAEQRAWERRRQNVRVRGNLTLRGPRWSQRTKACCALDDYIVPAASIIAKTVTVKRFIVTRPRAFVGKPTEGSNVVR